MHILEEVKADQLQARKDKNTLIANLLTTLLGEFDANSASEDGVKSISESDMQAIIKKFIKNNEFSAQYSDDFQRSQYALENEALIAYLPTQLTDEELTAIINGLPSTFSVGQVMSYLKTHHAGLYDGKLASTIVQNRNVGI